MEYLLVSSALVRLDASELDHLAPLICFVGHEFSKGGRCHRHRLSSQSKQPRLHSRISKDRVDLIVELADDRRWCVFGRAEPIPTDCLISLYELAHGRDVRQSLRTRRAGHCESTQSTCLDIACRRRHRSKRDAAGSAAAHAARCKNARRGSFITSLSEMPVKRRFIPP